MASRSGFVPEAACSDRVGEGAEVGRRFAFGFGGFFFESFFAHALTFFVFPFDPAEAVVDTRLSRMPPGNFALILTASRLGPSARPDANSRDRGPHSEQAGG